MKTVKITKPSEDVLVWKEELDLLANTQINVPKGVVAEIYTADGDIVQVVSNSTSIALNEKSFFGKIFGKKTNKYILWCFNQDTSFDLAFGGQAEYVDKTLRDRHTAKAFGTVTFAVKGIKGAKESLKNNSFSVQQYDKEIIKGAKETGVLNVDYFKAILQDKLNLFLKNALNNVVASGDRNYIEHSQDEIIKGIKKAIDTEVKGSWIECEGVNLASLTLEGYQYQDEVGHKIGEAIVDTELAKAQHEENMIKIEEAKEMKKLCSDEKIKDNKEKVDKDKNTNNNGSNRTKFCSRCGKKISADANFCEYCGEHQN